MTGHRRLVLEDGTGAPGPAGHGDADWGVRRPNIGSRFAGDGMTSTSRTRFSTGISIVIHPPSTD